MTLRDHFLQDPFFKSAWDDMETFRGSFFKDSQSTKMIETSEKREEKKDEKKEDNGFLNSRKFGRYLVPRKWMMPSLLDDAESLKLSDSGVINMVDDDTKLELSLNTVGYQPSELTVNVDDGQLVIEGRHQEKSEAGEMMVSRQFRRQYGLSSQSKLTEVVSNLSQDGVLVITVPKEKRIQELKEENKIKMERKKSVEKKEESNSAHAQQIKVENISGAATENRTKTTSLVPMNLRESFFDDPFFKDNWLDIQKSQNDFFSKAEERFSQQMKRMESTMNNYLGFSNMLNFNKGLDLDIPRLSLLDAEDLKVCDGEHKVELSLDTAGYKPDELKVTAGQGVVCVEGKHEERSQSGEILVSRHMSRQYQLPSSADPAQVTSNLSRDGVLIISIPKIKPALGHDRNVPITMK